jgi:glycine cleavage system H lipoate-binding protein
MSVLLAIATFALFIALDYLVTARSATGEDAIGERPAVPEPRATPALAPAFVPQPVWVAGYQLPEDFHYHRGHTWARQLDDDTVVVGLDDFARQLIGDAERIEAPPVGSRVRQGGVGFSIGLGGRSAELVSPVEGEVLETNRALARNPHLATEDPYGRGWVMKLRTSDLGRNLRNLLSGSTARKWTEDSRERIEHQLMALSGSVLTDGGRPVADFAAHLDNEDWRRLVGEFLLT